MAEESENLCVRVSGRKNEKVGKAVRERQVATGQNTSDAMAALVVEGAQAAELRNAGWEAVQMIQSLQDQHKATQALFLRDRRAVRDVVDRIIGSLRRGEPEVALAQALLLQGLCSAENDPYP